jgi:hypothetical protein
MVSSARFHSNPGRFERHFLLQRNALIYVTKFKIKKKEEPNRLSFKYQCIIKFEFDVNLSVKNIFNQRNVAVVVRVVGCKVFKKWVLLLTRIVCPCKIKLSNHEYIYKKCGCLFDSFGRI